MVENPWGNNLDDFVGQHGKYSQPSDFFLNLHLNALTS